MQYTENYLSAQTEETLLNKLFCIYTTKYDVALKIKMFMN